MTYGSNVLSKDPLFWLRLGETSGTTAADSSGNVRNGTHVGAVTLGATGLIDNDTDKAIQTTANTGTYVTIPFGSWMEGLTSFAVQEWVNFSSTPDNSNGDALVSRWTTTGLGGPWLLYRSTTGKPRFDIVTTSGRFNCEGTTVMAQGVDYDVMGMWDGSTLSILLDGVVENSIPTTGTLITSTLPIEIGRYAQSNLTVAGATHDEAVLYPVALTAEEAAQIHYASKNAAASAGLANEAKLNFLKMILGKSYTPYTQPLTVKLITSLCDASIPGVECDGEEYEEQPIVWDGSSGTTYVDNLDEISFATLAEEDDFDIYGYEIWDSSIEEQRIAFETFSSVVAIPASTSSIFNPHTLAIISDETNDLLSDEAEALVLEWVAGINTNLPFSIPLQVRLMTANGGESALGTECSGDLYVRQNVYWDDPALSGTGNSAYAFAKNSAVVTFSALSSTATTNITGYELWDTSGEPKRVAYQNYGAPVAVAANTVADFAIGALEFRVM